MKRSELIDYIDRELDQYVDSVIDIPDILKPVLHKLKSTRASQLGPIHERLKPTVAVRKDAQAIARLTAITIVGNLSMYSISRPSEEVMDNCIQILAGGNQPDRINAVRDELNNQVQIMPRDYLNSIRNERILPVSVVLYWSIANALFESSDDIKKARAKQRKTQYEILNEIVIYLRKEEVLDLNLEDGRETADFDEYAMSTILSYSKAALLWTYNEQSASLVDKRRHSMSEEVKRKSDRILKNAQKKKTTVVELPRMNVPILDRLDTFQNYMSASPENQLNPNKQMQILTAIGIERSTASQLVEIMQEHKRSAEDLENALNNFRDSLSAEQNKVLNDVEQTAIEIDEIAISESLLMAICAGDELTKLDFGGFVLNNLRQNSALPVAARDLFQLQDSYSEDNGDMFWNDNTPGENGALALKIADDIDLIDLNRKDEPRLFYSVRLSAVLASYGGRQFEGPLEIRKSLVKAFREAGFSERKARDYAIIVATMQMVNRQTEPAVDDYDFVRTLPSIRASDDARVAAAEKAGDEAKKQLKNSEKENKRCRHENAVLRNEIENLRTELEKKQDYIRGMQQLLDLKDKIVQDETDDLSVAIQFPYTTQKKIVLYGGHDSFLADIQKLLPDIRIIKPASQPDYTPIHNADLLIIQVNKTGHPGYWKAISEAQKHNVPTFHLKYAGPKRCAEEIVKELSGCDN